MKVIEAVLETLGKRLPKKLRENLASQLPGELRPFVLEYNTAEFFSLDVFYQRVARRSELSFHDAVKHARSVMRVVREAVAPGQMRIIFADLPPEFEELVGRLPEQMSGTTVDAHEYYSKR